jgi:FkbM family methyltransferase
MSTLKSGIRSFAKPILYKLLGNRFYKYAQYYGKKRDIKYRLIDEREMFLLSEFIKPGDTVLDLGANFAYYTERMSKIVGDSGKVYAYEPIPFTFEVLKMLVKYFKLNNVTYYQKGVSNKTETVRFTVPKMDIGTLSTGQAHIAGRKNDIENNNDYKFTQEETFDCEVVALDEFYSNSLPNLTFIKIDIEGAELFALKGAKNLLHQYKPVILIEINPIFLEGFGLTEADMLDFIKETGYEIFYLNEATQKLVPLNNKPLWEFNFLLIPSEKINLYKNIIDHVQQ